MTLLITSKNMKALLIKLWTKRDNHSFTKTSSLGITKGKNSNSISNDNENTFQTALQYRTDDKKIDNLRIRCISVLLRVNE